MKRQKTENRKQNIELAAQKRRMGFSPCCIMLCVIIMFILSGCGGDVIEPLSVCPGKANVAESLAALQSQSENITPLYTNKGKFSVEYYKKDKLEKVHLDIRHLLIKPPSEIFVQGDAGMVNKAMVLGSNTQEFWLDIKPDPLNSYWWGRWSDQDSDAGIMINPRIILDALGLAEIDSNANWSLLNEGPYDILTKTENGIVNKKLYIHSCEYRVRKIEYNDSYGEPIALVKLDKYREVSPGFFIPFSIEINSQSENIEETLNIKIKLVSIKPAEKEHINHEINRPKTPSRDHVYRVINGREIEQ